jgi:uncharacterized membrane protein
MASASSGGQPPGSRTPGIVISALVFALLGFACAVPAVVGLILGLMARPRAKEAGAGVGLATAAIAVSAAWLVLFGVLIVFAMRGTGS